MYVLVVKACVSPIRQPEKKNDQDIILKETRKRGQGAEYTTFFQTVFESLCFICEIYFIF